MYNQGYGARVGLHSEQHFLKNGKLVRPDYLLFRGMVPANKGGKTLLWDRKPAFHLSLENLINRQREVEAIKQLSWLFLPKGLTITQNNFKAKIPALSLNGLNEVIVPQSPISSARTYYKHTDTLQVEAESRVKNILAELSFEQKLSADVEEIDLQLGDYIVLLNSRIEHGRQEYFGKRFIQRLMINSPQEARGFSIEEKFLNILKKAQASSHNLTNDFEEQN